MKDGVGSLKGAEIVYMYSVRTPEESQGSDCPTLWDHNGLEMRKIHDGKVSEETEMTTSNDRKD